MLADNDPRHGTLNGYGNLKCRCTECRKVWAASVDRRKKTRVAPPLDDPRHGTENIYNNYMCRCQPCTRNWYEATSKRAARRKANTN